MTVCGPSPKFCNKLGSTKSSKMSLKAIALSTSTYKYTSTYKCYGRVSTYFWPLGILTTTVHFAQVNQEPWLNNVEIEMYTAYHILLAGGQVYPKTDRCRKRRKNPCPILQYIFAVLDYFSLRTHTHNTYNHLFLFLSHTSFSCKWSWRLTVS